MTTTSGESVERREFMKFALGGALGSAALPMLPQQARALDYPTRPVHMLVGQAAGSSSDISARLVGQYLSDHFGQQFVVDIRPGATGNVATEAVVRSAPDGYTLLLVNSQNTINQAMFPDLPFDFMHDIAPIAITHRVALVMEVLPTFPAQTVPEFIAYAKANPGKINMASAGVGGPQHVAGELFKYMAGVNLVHVPYHGTTPALVDLLAGQVQVMFDVTPTSLPHIRAGKLKPLAVTTPERVDFLPGVPAMAEFLPGYEAFGWIGYGAPRDTPAPIITVLNKGINDAVADPAIKARLTDLGGLVMPPNTPAEFAKFIAADTEKWVKVVKSANLKPE
ncbi:MAG TPA: tripartite tricarboxylate transporter substrate binding protein [Xanthobacteraceae bacterium]|nr:tripartite tricarboxylate transporter substrate binding protein [Xanthobacteraceae bacterium]